ncbi:MAG: GNAT family N-acetyltransferase [Saprospiraceae bacterium]|jgi:GNAT superfamily N-acetyltransferase|nr:GNAT family N-acetyltransferase [Saprospiraceae bacterium]
MKIREATVEDIPQIQIVRNSVHENTLSDPGLVTDADCADYLTRRGKGWVCEIDGQIVGFAIVDVHGRNVWALFLRPEYERQGIGRQLHDRLLDWYFSQTPETLWLSTSPGTRAERFYRKAGWQEAGTYGKGEVKFEMTQEAWMGNNIQS